jgi:hypothetical protein
MNGGDQMSLVLEADVGVQAVVDNYLEGAVVQYMVFNQKNLPKHIDADDDVRIEMDVKTKTINHFPITNVSGAMEYGDLIRQISCRAYTETEAVSIQDASKEALNRNISADTKVFFIVDVLPIIEPAGDDDNYNAPLSVRTIQRNN